MQYIAIKLIAYTLFSLIVMMLSLVISNYAVMCLTSVGIYLVNIALNNFRYTDTYNPLKLINLVSTSAVTPLYERYRAFELFGRLVNTTSFTIVLYLSAILVCVFLILYVYCRFFSCSTVCRSVVIKKLRLLATRVIEVSDSNRILRRRAHLGSMSLYGHEFYKTIISTKHIWVLILLVIVKVNWSNYSMTSIDSYTEKTYHSYMTTLSQATPSEQEEFLLEEKSRIKSTIEKYDEFSELYAEDKISLHEYSEYLFEYNRAFLSNSTFIRIEQHKDYIDELAMRGYDADFVYDTGWKQLLFGDFDWTLFIAIMLICSNIFACEYDKGLSADGFVQILRTTKQGRSRTFCNKYIVAMLSSITLFTVWNVIDFVKVTTNYELPCISSPIQSLESFDGFLPHISIGEYLVCFYLTKLAAAVILSSFVFILSSVIHRAVQVIIIASAVTVLPLLLSSIGISALSGVDFTGLMTATPMLRRNLYAFGYLAVCIGICVTLNHYAWRGWNYGVKHKKFM